MVTEKWSPSRSRIPGVPKPVNILEIGNPGQTTELIIHNGKIYVYNAEGQTLIDGGIIQTAALAARSIVATKLAIGQSAFTHNITHYALNYYQVYFYAGTIYFANGQSVSTDAGWVNVSITTYIYYNGTSTLAATTNISNTVGDNKVLVAICRPGSDWGQYISVEYQQAAGTTIDGNQIITQSISAIKLDVVSINASGEINATYIKTGNLVVGGIGGYVGKISFLDDIGEEYGKIDSVGLVFDNSKGIYLQNVGGAGNSALFYNNASNNTTIRMGSGGYLSILNNSDEVMLLFEGSTGIIQSARTGYSVGTTDTGGGKITTFRGAVLLPNSEGASSIYNYGTISFGQTFTKDPVVFVTPCGVQNPSTYCKLDYATYTYDATFKNSGENIKIAQSFQIATQKYIDLVSIFLTKGPGTTGYLYCDICSDDAGDPGTILGTSAALNISTMSLMKELNFLFATPIQLSASTTYWIVFRTTGYTYTPGVYELITVGDNTNKYANGQAKEWDGANWNNLDGDANMDIHFNIYERYQDAFDDTNSSAAPIGAFDPYGGNLYAVLFSGQIEDILLSSATLILTGGFKSSLRYLFTCLFYGVP